MRTHTLSDYPKELQKKITLLQHFRSYLETNSTKEGAGSSKNLGDIEMKDSSDSSSQGVYVKKWMRTKHAIMFRLSNKIVQVNF
jgi:polo-like kinase 1